MKQQRSGKAEIFLAATDIADPAERTAYLERACGKDLLLKAEIEELLEHDQADDSLLDRPAPGLNPAVYRQIGEGPGTQIGPYKLREQIGEGGFGVVYVAEQETPVARKVALKIIKPGMDTKNVIARFEAERQALALMDHPNVARVFDAGATDSGRSYFVMELVKGIPITDFCDDQKLSTRERLALFMDVCRAVQHAHQKGIIHRDLKPSNVMVTLHDDKPVVKVIDFGVSKALSSKLTEKTIYTSYGQMIGTPLYMSPEQAQLSGLDVDTRSDVYSLGVLLYELLTGSPPFDKETLTNAGFDKFRRILCEEDPQRPSTRISTLEVGKLATISDRRRVDPRKLGPSYRGELDWIVMKALEKDRNRRYESASAFSADVERFLRNEPVEACPPSLSYRFRKFVHRRKGILTTAILIVLSLLLGSGISIWQAVQATQQAHRARVAEGLADRRLKQVDEQRQIAENNFQQAEAERKRAEANVRLAHDALEEIYLPLMEGKFLKTAEFGESINLSQHDFQILEKALPFYEQLAAQKTADPHMQRVKAEAYLRIASIHNRLALRVDGHNEKGEATLRQAIPLLEDVSKEFPDDLDCRYNLASAYRSLAYALSRQQAEEEAEIACRHAISIYEELIDHLPPATREELADLQKYLGYHLCIWGKPSEAGEPLRKALAHYEKLATEFPNEPNHRVGVAVATRRLGDYYRVTKQPQRAEQYYRKAADEAERLIAAYPDYPLGPLMRGESLTALSQTLRSSGQLEEAESLARQAVKLLEDGMKRWPQKKLAYAQVLGHRTYLELGRLFKSSGRLEEAIKAYRRSLELKRGIAAAAPQDEGVTRSIVAVRRTLVSLLTQLGRKEDALELLSETEPTTAQEYLQRGRLHMELKQFDEALADYEKAVEVDPTNGVALRTLWEFLLVFGPKDLQDGKRALDLAEKLVELEPDKPGNWVALSLIHRYLHQTEAAVVCAQKALDIDPRNIWGLMRLSEAESARGNFEKALQLAQRVIAVNPNIWGGWSAQGTAFTGLGRYDESIQSSTKALEIDPTAWWIYSRRAGSLMRAGRYHDALRDWESLLAQRPDMIDLVDISGLPSTIDAALQSGFLRLADRVLEQLPRSIGAHFARGRMHARFGDREQAKRDCLKAISSSLAGYFEQYQYAVLCLRLDDQAAYRNTCRKMLETFAATDEPAEARFTAWTCALAPGVMNDYTQALRVAGRTIKQVPRDSFALQLLGAIQFRAGQFDEARNSLTAATRAERNKEASLACSNYFLSMTHKQLGNSAEARNTLKTANEQAERELNNVIMLTSWSRRFTLELLRRQAEEMLGAD